MTVTVNCKLDYCPVEVYYISGDKSSCRTCANNRANEQNDCTYCSGGECDHYKVPCGFDRGEAETECPGYLEE